jgi:hypothetical protein
MSRLFSSLQDGSGRRFFFALTDAPGYITPGVAQLVMQGRQPLAVEPQAVFRTPTPAMLTVQGLALGSNTFLSPATATLGASGQTPDEVRSLTITPSLAPPVESPPQPFVPTLVTIWTTQPDVGQITLTALPHNVTQGGNIGFVTPAPAALAVGSLAFTLLYGEAGVGAVSIVGLAPTLERELTITPDVGQLVTSQLAPRLELPFIWIDDDPAPATSWITDAAA